ncbi:MAG: VOC family protein [Actinomycetota bacterium]|nr:VOC family protein [Actinomycetota bacterium]
MITLRHVTVDCRDAAVLAAFWSAALDRPVDEGANPYYASIGIGFRSRQPAWLFLQVPEPKTAKNRMHVDFSTDERGAEVQRLVALGASTHGEHDEYGVRWTVLADPEGNEFCVGGPRST